MRFIPPPDLALFPTVAADTETTGLRWEAGDRPFALSISVPETAGYQGPLDWCLDLRQGNQLAWARENLPRAPKTVWFNAKFDLHMLRTMGVNCDPARAVDTATRAALIYEHLPSYSLGAIAEYYKLDHQKDTGLYEAMAELFGGKATRAAQMPRIADAPWPLVARYAVADTRTTLALYDWQLPELGRQELDRVDALERALLPVLLDMERVGVRVDVAAAERRIDECTVIVDQLQRELDAVAGFGVNVNSSAHLARILDPRPVVNDAGEVTHYMLAGDGTFVPRTDTGAPSMNKDVLQRTLHPAGQLAHRIKLYLKARDTFLKGHILGYEVKGRVHPTYNSTRMSQDGDDYGTGSGRFSANAPNVQQISKRNKEMGALIRSLFLPDEGQEWTCIDYSQMDFRVMSHFLKNSHIDGIYLANPEADFHQLVADMTGLPRSPKPGIKGDAKSINLGLCFGMGKGKLAEQMGLPYTVAKRRDGSEYLQAGPEAEEIFAAYHRAVPGVKAMLDVMVNRAKSRGYVKTMIGRRMRFPRGERTYKAGAMIFQGNAAEALKVKLVQIHALLKGTPGRIMANIHDEIAPSLPPTKEGRELGRAVLQEYTRFDGNDEWGLKFRTPIRGSLGTGVNWWEASK